MKTKMHKPKKQAKKTLPKKMEFWLAQAVIINASESEFNELLQNLKPEDRKWLTEVVTKSTVFTTPHMCCLLPGLQAEK